MKSIFTKTIIALSLLAIAAAFSGCSKEKAERVVIKGSTTNLPITQKAAEAFRKVDKNISITIEGSGSGNGIKAILDGTCDIANSSRAMKEKELQSAVEKGLKIKEYTIALDMIVPIVHPSNPVKNITMNQLKGVYDGSISNWKQLGGKDEAIVIISRDTSSGTYEVWSELVMKKSDVRKDALLQASNGAIVSAIAGNPKAIGYVGYGYLTDSIKTLTVDGVEGNIANGKSGKFAISRGLYKYVNENKYSAEAKKFMEFVMGPEGQKLVKEAGFIPVN